MNKKTLKSIAADAQRAANPDRNLFPRVTIEAHKPLIGKPEFIVRWSELPEPYFAEAMMKALDAKAPGVRVRTEWK